MALCPGNIQKEIEILQNLLQAAVLPDRKIDAV
jgi:hypothetical protein